MEFLNNIKNETIIICNNNTKINILKHISNNPQLLPIKFLTLNELVKKYYFDFDEKAILYVMQTRNVKFDIAKTYIKNTYYVEDKIYNNEKLDFLVALKKELINNKLLITDKNFINFLKNKDIIVYNFNYFDKFYQNLFEQLNKISNLTIFNKTYNNYTPTIYKFKTMEEEVSFVASSICDLIENGINIKNIKLANVKEDYYNTIEKIFNFYNLKINLNKQNPIISSTISKYFLDNYESDISLTINKLKDKYKENEIINKIINICNKYVWTNDFLEVKPLIINDLKNTKFDKPLYKDGIDIIDYKEDIITDDDYIFMLSFNQGVIPSIYKDEDYITDNLKSYINLDTTISKNKQEKLSSINNIKNIKNLTITYKEKNSFRSFYPSPLIEEMHLSLKDAPSFKISYSKIYDEITLATYLDDFIKYGTLNKNLSLLYSSYKIPYITYDNKFKPINTNNLYKLINNKISLSYTSLDSYFKCNFKYYLDNILKLNIYEESLATFIGNIFHHILEIGLTKEIDFNYEFNKYIKESEKTFSYKDTFFINKLKEDLRFTLETIKNQTKLSSLNNYLLEENVIINHEGNVSVTFRGKIDKIMYQEKDGITITALVDYKTGEASCNLKYLKDGINMQLPIYLYLAKNSPKLKNIVFAGFYLQKISHKKLAIDPKKDIETLKKDQLKLVGYSTSNEEILNMFDKSYKDSKLITGMGVKNDGNFKATSKILNDEQMNSLVTFTKDKIEEATNSILEGKFAINPKSNENEEQISCKFCSYKDICFKRSEDIVNITSDNDLTFLQGGTDELD